MNNLEQRYNKPLQNVKAKTPILSTQNLTVGIESDGLEYPLLQDINLAFLTKSIYQLQGGNGIGKTRLMETLAGIHLPLSGKIRIQQATPLYIAHQTGLKPWLNVVQSIRHNVYLFCDGVWPEQDFLNRLNQALDELNLSDKKSVLIKHLSHGQQKKVALAWLWFESKKLWLLDEPFSGLDSQSVRTIKRKLNNHVSKDNCVILSHHNATPLNPQITETICVDLHAFSPLYLEPLKTDTFLKSRDTP